MTATFWHPLASTAWFSVEAYGAVGDGSTNNTTAMQAAITAASSDGGGVVLIPTGTFVTDPLDVPDNITIAGLGWGSVIKLRAQNVSTLGDHGILQVYGTSGAYLTNVHFRDFAIDGNQAAMTGTKTLNMEGIDFKYVAGGSVERVLIHDTISEGFDFDYCEDMTVVGNVARDCGGNGYHLSNGAVANLLAFNLAEGCGVAWTRQGFDQYGGSSPEGNRNRFVGNRSISNYRNWRIEGTLAVFAGNTSEGSPTAANVFTATDGEYNPLSGAGVDLSAYASATGAAAGKAALTKGDDTWELVANPGAMTAGTDEIADTTSTVDVTHGLGHTPETVLITPRGGELVWASARTTTTFTASRTGTSGALGFDWLATGTEATPPSGFNPWDAAYPTPLHAAWAEDPLWTPPSDGAAVTTWRNESGTVDLTQSTGSAQPTYRASTVAYNDRPTVQFDGSDALGANVTNVSQPFIMIAVGNTSGFNSTSERIMSNNGVSGGGMGDHSSNAWTLSAAGTPSIRGGTADSSPHIWCGILNGASSALYIDGALIVTGDAGTTDLQWFAVGANFSGGVNVFQGLIGHVAYAAFYAGSTRTAGILALEAALATHYGITI